MTNAIEAAGLRKRFGAATALDGLDLTVREGEVHAFLAPNGAGKPVTGLRHSFPAGKRPPYAG
jgi:ABC-2 type transport system ATP-binding protein